MNISGCSVTVNIPVLGTGDSGFESRHPDKVSKKFAKKKEDFICEKCGNETKGSGYTNHCSFCLWSKHVDINPGDRLSPCQGMMRPIRVEGSTGENYKVVHKCIICGHEKINRIEEGDREGAILFVIKEAADKFSNSQTPKARY